MDYRPEKDKTWIVYLDQLLGQAAAICSRRLWDLSLTSRMTGLEDISKKCLILSRAHAVAETSTHSF